MFGTCILGKAQLFLLFYDCFCEMKSKILYSNKYYTYIYMSVRKAVLYRLSWHISHLKLTLSRRTGQAYSSYPFDRGANYQEWKSPSGIYPPNSLGAGADQLRPRLSALQPRCRSAERHLLFSRDGRRSTARLPRLLNQRPSVQSYM